MKKIITTVDAPTPIGPYNQAVQHGDTIFLSGQIALDPATMILVNGTIKEETEQVMQNLAAVLKAAGSDFSKVIKTTIFLSDMDYFQEVNEVYGSHFDEAIAPARETVAVRKLPKSVNVEIAMIAHV